MRLSNRSFVGTVVIGLIATISSSAGAARDTRFLRQWSKNMARSALPKGSCFEATYPDTAWVETPCVSPPNTPLIPAGNNGRGRPVPLQVGNGTYEAASSSFAISWAEGSFLASGITTSTSNNYSLQLNTNRFTTPACNGISGCVGWQQFAYLPTGTNGTTPQIFIQYWLIGYGPGTACPAGWRPSLNDCWKNSPAGTQVPSQSAVNLGSQVVTGVAGSSDSVRMTDGTGTIYAYSAPTSVLSLSGGGWKGAAFNAYGPGNPTNLSFNSGTALVVQILTDNPTALSCTTSGFNGDTAETNNLTIVPNSCCDSGEGIQFAESSNGQSGFSCPATGGGDATFWGFDSGYTGQPIGDWAYGSYKCQSPPGMGIDGISASATPGHAHNCIYEQFPGLVQNSSCRAVLFDPGNNQNPGVYYTTQDWDFGFYKAACNNNEYAAGVSQSTAGAINGLLCCPATGGTTAASSCNVQVFANQNSSGYTPPDWDFGYSKGECYSGDVVFGVSAYANGSGAPHALLCCHAP